MIYGFVYVYYFYLQSPICRQGGRDFIFQMLCQMFYHGQRECLFIFKGSAK